MNLQNIIQELLAEKARLEVTITALESLAATSNGDIAPATRRGRKSMGEDERRAVSERMKRYWANRRAGRVRAASAT